MVDKKLAGAGLRGQVAGLTTICTVGQEGTGLTYRGYDIEDLATNTRFEEVAYLILYGRLPNFEEMKAYQTKLQSLRALPDALKELLECIPKETHPMEVMRTGCSMLGNLEPEEDFSQQQEIADRLVAIFPAIICYWYRYSHDGVRIETETDAIGLGGYFLQLLYGKPAPALYDRVMSVSLILYAEHEFNASTFTGRICASTLSDMYSCITGAVGSLRGPLHGGANEEAMALIDRFSSPDEAKEAILKMLAAKDKIMGFGHAIYRTSDPRSAIIKLWAEKLADEAGNTSIYDIAEAIETVMWDEKELFANADFFHAPTYRYMNIPTKLFTPLFVCARTVGWAAHVMEQRANNRIIRPSADYTGPTLRKVIPMDER